MAVNIPQRCGFYIWAVVSFYVGHYLLHHETYLMRSENYNPLLIQRRELKEWFDDMSISKVVVSLPLELRSSRVMAS